MGDGGSGGDPQNHGQTPSSRLAKLLRTNPLSVDWEIAGYGLRNPWRFSFDRKTGDLYIGDVGQNAREEIDYRPRGAPPANFGWARYEGAARSTGDVALDPPSPLVFPIHEYGHGEGCSVTGGYVYRGRPSRRPSDGTSSATTARARSGACGSSAAGGRRAAQSSTSRASRRSARARAASSTSSRTKARSTGWRARSASSERTTDGVAAERCEQPVEGARARLEARAGARRPGGGGDAGQRLRRGREGADARACRRQASQLCVRGRVGRR